MIPVNPAAMISELVEAANKTCDLAKRVLGPHFTTAKLAEGDASYNEAMTLYTSESAASLDPAERAGIIDLHGWYVSSNEFHGGVNLLTLFFA
jgi:hypothetical protein